MGKYVQYDEKKLEEIAKKEKDSGNTIVLAGGGFEIITKGHIYALTQFKKYGDILFINVCNDERVKFKKGEKRPIIKDYWRAHILSKFEMVDYITVYPSVKEGPSYDPTYGLAKIIKPDILVQPKYRRLKKETKEELEKAFGHKPKIKYFLEKYYKNSHTSDMIEKILMLNLGDFEKEIKKELKQGIMSVLNLSGLEKKTKKELKQRIMLVFNPNDSKSLGLEQRI